MRCARYPAEDFCLPEEMGNYLTAPSGNNATIVPEEVTKKPSITIIPNIEVGPSPPAKEQQNIIAKDLCSVEVSMPGLKINPASAQEILSKLGLSQVNDFKQEVKPTIVYVPTPVTVEEKPLAAEEVNPTDEEKILEVPLPTGPKSAKKKGKKHRH